MLLIPVLMNPGPSAKTTNGAGMKYRRNKRSLAGAPRNARGRLIPRGGAAPRNTASGRKLTKTEALAGRILVPGHITQAMIDQADAVARAQRRAFGAPAGSGRKKKGVSRPKNVAKRATEVAAVVRAQQAHRKQRAANAAAKKAANAAAAAAKRKRMAQAKRTHNEAKKRNVEAAARVRNARAAAKTTAEKKAAAAAKRRRTTDRKRLGGMAASDAWRAKPYRKGSTRARGSTRGRSYVKGTKYATTPETINFSEAAYRSGAVYPARYPSGHPQAGKSHPRAGRAMTFDDALHFQVPVVGYLSREMIKGHFDRIPKTATGAVDRKNRKALNAARNYLETMRYGGVKLKDGTYVPRGGYKKLSAAKRKGAKRVLGLAAQRHSDGSAWRRAPAFYPRSGKTPSGQVYRKGARKSDYKQSWSTTPAKWQGGGGEYLHVKFRRGRGTVHRTPVVLGFGPSKREVDTLQLGGFGGPVDSPGGRVKLNSGRRGKRRKSARRPRNSKGHFLKVKANGKKRRGRRNGKKKSIVAKVWNNGRRARRNKKRTGRKHARRDAKGHFVKTNGKRRYKRNRRHKGAKVKANGRRGRRAKHNGRRGRRAHRNPGFKLQLDTLMSKGFALRVGHAIVGMTGTMLISDALMNVGPIRRLAFMSGMAGTAARFGLCLASASALSAGAYMLKDKSKLIGPEGWLNVLVGGATYGVVNALYELGVGGRYLPKLGAGPRAAAPMADWMELSGMGGGMGGGLGSVMDASSLVAGESAAQPFQMGGLGSGGVPIPIEDLRGYPGQYGGGLRDWVELQPDAAVDKDAVGAAGESF